jgi:hypothetical protein
MFSQYSDRAYSCDREFYGVNIEQLHLDVHHDLWTALEMAWAVGSLSRPETSRIKIRRAPAERKNTRNIWIAADKIYITDYFLRAFIFTAFSRHDPIKFNRLEDVTAFKKTIFENSGRGIPVDFYPIFLGFTEQECREIYQNAGKKSPLFKMGQSTLKTSILFWLLHEIAHSKLEHRAGVTVSTSWEQEFEADMWALNVMSNFHSPEVFIFMSGAIVETMSLFSDVSPQTQFSATFTHPPIACRKLNIINLAEEILLKNPKIDEFSAARLEVSLMRITKDFLLFVKDKNYGCKTR